MGVVVAAHHIDLDEKVAIKFLLPETLTNDDAVERFTREARAAVKIKSEHVARVSDVGRLENGAPYMVMEYLEGGDLAAWLRQRGPLPIEQAAELLLQACEAIAEAHALGIVHRDLKPANLFVIRRPDGVLSVKVLDFGISKLTNLRGPDGEAAMTKTSATMGSPLYMSPEQMQSSRDVDARSDIWSLGVILHELITDTVPFAAATMPELVLKIMSGEPTPLRSNLPGAPAELEALILKCLETDRGKRFHTVGEFASALLPFAPKRSKASVERISGVMIAAGLTRNALPMPPSSAPAELVPGGGTMVSWARTTTRKRSRNTMLLVGAAVAAVAAVTVLVVQSRDRGPVNPPETSAAAIVVNAPAPAMPPPPPRPSAVVESAAAPTPVPSINPVAAPKTVVERSPAAHPAKAHGPSSPAPIATSTSPTAASPVASQQSAISKPEPTATRPPSPTARPADEGAFDDRK
jgi:serine/threonine-protein kinase